MNFAALALWSLCLLLLGYSTALSFYRRGESPDSLSEVIASSWAYGSGWLVILAIVLRFLDRFTLGWLLAAVSALVMILVYWRRNASFPRPRPGTRPAWVLMACLLMAQTLVLWPLRDNAFGVDSYFWADKAERLACSPADCEGESLLVPVFRPDPSGYAYLLATARIFGVDLAHGEALIGLSLLWTVFSMLGALALVGEIAGPFWGAAAALCYVGSYWTQYFLLTSVARQGWGLGLATLLFLRLVKKGTGVAGDPAFYVLAAVGWLVHPFSVLVPLLVLPFVLMLEIRPDGLARLREAGGVRTVLTAGLALPFVVLLSRFVLSVLGLVSDAPFKYAMERFDPVALFRTMGPLNLLILALAWQLWLRRRILSPRTAWISSCALLVILVLIGVFPRDWYKASYIALPPHRYYLFYPLVTIVWLGLLGKSFSRVRPSSLAWWIGMALLGLGQWSLDAYFARRMLLPRPGVQAGLEAARWVDHHAAGGDRVALAFREPETVVMSARAVLAPRPTDTVPESELASAATKSRARFLITDLPFGDGVVLAGFQGAGRRVNVFELSVPLPGQADEPQNQEPQAYDAK